MSFLVIFMAFLMGIAGGFLAMHFYSVKQEYITHAQFSEYLDQLEHELQGRSDAQMDFLRDAMTDQNARINYFDKKMNDHYCWSLGIWNRYADLHESIQNPIPDSLQDVARAEVQLSEDEVLPMGPVDKVFENPTEGIEAAVKMATGVDISDGSKPKKKKGKKNVNN